MSQRQRWRQKFSAAFTGLAVSIRREDSFIVHIVVAIAVIGIALWLRLPLASCAILSLTIASVFAAELLNTSIESLARTVHPDRHPEIGRCLDAAAAAVLAMSVGAIVVGVALVGPPLYRTCLKFLTFVSN